MSMNQALCCLSLSLSLLDMYLVIFCSFFLLFSSSSRVRVPHVNRSQKKEKKKKQRVFIAAFKIILASSTSAAE